TYQPAHRGYVSGAHRRGGPGGRSRRCSATPLHPGTPFGGAGDGSINAAAAHYFAGRNSFPDQSSAGMSVSSTLPDRPGTVSCRGAGVAASRARTLGCVPPGRPRLLKGWLHADTALGAVVAFRRSGHHLYL